MKDLDEDKFRRLLPLRSHGAYAYWLTWSLCWKIVVDFTVTILTVT
jgi:hypothetical protein